MNNSSLILSSHYLPCIEYIHLCADSKVILLDRFEYYSKGSYRNRAHIASAQGVQRLSIPLEKGKHQQLPVKEVRISYSENWQHVHWQALCSCYNHSPFFEYYRDDLELFYKKRITFFLDWNTQLLQWLFQAFKLTISIGHTSQYTKTYSQEIRDAREDFSPKKNTTSLIAYKQVFEEQTGFLPNLSSIDMLFNTGTLLKK